MGLNFLKALSPLFSESRQNGDKSGEARMGVVIPSLTAGFPLSAPLSLVSRPRPSLSSSISCRSSLLQRGRYLYAYLCGSPPKRSLLMLSFASSPFHIDRDSWAGERSGSLSPISYPAARRSLSLKALPSELFSLTHKFGEKPQIPPLSRQPFAVRSLREKGRVREASN